MFNPHPNNKIQFAFNKYNRVFLESDYESLSGRVKVAAGSLGTIASNNSGVYGIVFDNDIDQEKETRAGALDIPYSKITFIASHPPKGQDIVEAYVQELSQGNLIEQILEKNDLPLPSDYFKEALVEGLTKRYYDKLLFEGMKPSHARAVLLDAFRTVVYEKNT